MSFPLNPINGQKTVQNHITYVYSTSTNSWRRDFNNALDQLYIVGNHTATSTTTGALIVFNGVGIGQDLYVGGVIYQNGEPISAGKPWTYINSDYSASTGDRLLVDTTASTVTITLPLLPSIGNTVEFIDYYGTCETYPIVFEKNGENIMGINENMLINLNNAANVLIYIDPIQGWKFRTL